MNGPGGLSGRYIWKHCVSRSWLVISMRLSLCARLCVRACVRVCVRACVRRLVLTQESCVADSLSHACSDDFTVYFVLPHGFSAVLHCEQMKWTPPP